MKTNFLIKLLFLFFCLFSASFAWSQSGLFYYAFNEQLSLTPVPNKMLVIATDSATPTQINNAIASVTLASAGALTVTASFNSKQLIISSSSAADVSNIVTALQGNNLIYTSQPMYQHNGLEMGVGDHIVLRFPNGTPSYKIDSLRTAHNLTQSEAHTAFLRWRVQQGANVLNISKLLYESGLTRYAHPDFIAEVTPSHIPNDEFFPMQFNMHSTSQTIPNENHVCTDDADVDAPEAWDISKGSSDVVIAIVDQGTTSNHPDLMNSRQLRLPGSNIAEPYDATTDSNDPSPIGNGNHGNACAGVAAATQDNGIGISGICPECLIMPVRVTFGWVPASMFAEAIEFAYENGAGIISNSWNFGSSDPNAQPVIVSAIEDAVTLGRGGLGSVVLFAASNSARHSIGDHCCINFPGNVDIPGVITVGASDRDDLQADYSATSDPLSSNNQYIDVVATSHKAYADQIANESVEVWSLDIPGNTGYNPIPPGMDYNPPALGETLPNTPDLEYTGRFGGTSAATPLVAGIVGLLLSEKSDLTQLEVFDLITCSAEDVGGYAYTNGYSNEMGHGRANAFNALMSLCPDNYQISWLLNENQNIKYQSSDFLRASNLIGIGSEIDLKAQGEVRLLPGFRAEMGSEVRAHIAPCANCDNGYINSVIAENDVTSGSAKTIAGDTIIASNGSEIVCEDNLPNDFCYKGVVTYDEYYACAEDIRWPIVRLLDHVEDAEDFLGYTPPNDGWILGPHLWLANCWLSDFLGASIPNDGRFHVAMGDTIYFNFCVPDNDWNLGPEGTELVCTTQYMPLPSDGSTLGPGVVVVANLSDSPCVSTGGFATSNHANQLKTSPNPTNEQINISYYMKESGNLHIAISDIMGRVLKEHTQEWQTQGEQQQTIDLRDLPKGLYFCTVRMGEQTITQKVFKN